MAPRSPPSSGSSESMPCAEWAMQRKVPTRLIWTMKSNASVGKRRISPVFLSRLAVLIALPVPAQFTRMRSWPFAARAFLKPSATLSSFVTSTRANTPPNSAATASPLLTLRSNSATFTPCLASARAVASPRPDAPPVMTAEIDEFSSMSFPLLKMTICRTLRPAQKRRLEHHLRLRHHRHELAVLARDPGLPDGAAPSDMDRHRFRLDRRSFLGRADEIGLAFDGGGAAGALGQVEECARRPQ